MRRDDVIMTVALCVSLIVHGALAVAFVRSTVNERIYLPGVERQIVAGVTVDPDSVFGRVDGGGKAPQRFISDRELFGREAPRPQPFLSRDPSGMGKVGVDPTMNLIAGEDGDGKQRGAQTRAQEQQPPRVALATEAQEAALIGTDSKIWDAKEPRVARKPASRAIAKSAVLPRGGVGGRPGTNAPAADPAPLTESESDAFAEVGSVEVSAGNVDARLGREVKTVRPRLSLAGQLELLAMQSRKMTLRLHLDARGKVLKLDILKSSGSASADQDVKLAVYKWEFDPRPGRSPDIVEFDLVWR